MMRKTLISFGLAMSILAPSVSYAEDFGPFEAYWVFVGATKGSYEESGAAGRRIVNAAKKCGFSAVGEPSWKFQAAEGKTIYALDEFFPVQKHGGKGKAKAEAIRAKVSKCIPDAYVKKVVYSGE